MNNNRRNFLTGAGAITGAVAAAAVSKVAMAALPEPDDPGQARHHAAARPEQRPAVQPGRHAQRLDAALAHEQRRQGIPPGRRARRARDGARLQGPPVGLQRPVARPHDRSGRRRPRAHLRHQQAARAHQHPLARPAPAQRHGRRDGPDPESHRSGQDLRVRVRRAPPRHLHVPPPRGRDDADGDGHDGLLGHAPERPAPADRRGGPRLRVPAQRLRHRAGLVHAEDHDHAGLQPLVVEQPHLSRASTRSTSGWATRCASASATSR